MDVTAAGATGSVDTALMGLSVGWLASVQTTSVNLITNLQIVLVWLLLRSSFVTGSSQLAFLFSWHKKTRRTKEEVGRQHQGMDRPGVRQVPNCSGEQGKWRKLVAKSSVVPRRPLRLRD